MNVSRGTPWKAVYVGDSKYRNIQIRRRDNSTVAVWEVTDQAWEDAKHIVACVNMAAGLKPLG